MDVTTFNSELLSALRDDNAAVFKAELEKALGDNLSSIKSELLTLKTELSGNIAAVQSNVTGLKGNVREMSSLCQPALTTLLF